MKNFIYSISLLAAFLLYGCAKDKSIGSNAVLLSDASINHVYPLAVGATEDATYNLSVRAAKVLGDGPGVQADVKIDQDYLDAYNKENKTDFKLLPDTYYTLSATSTTIKGGTAIADPIKVTIKPLTGLPESDKYVLPLTIAGAKGLPILEASKSILLKLQRTIITNAADISYSSLKAIYPAPLTNVKAWTFEWRVKKTGNLNGSNQAMMRSFGTNSEFYTRFEGGPIELKLGSLGNYRPDFTLQENIWYHMAAVYDGSSVKWYVDGVLALTAGVSGIFNFSDVGIGNETTPQVVNEMRFWTVARTQGQIVDNMSTAVDPASEGLYGYWKCNEGEGNVVKDATKNGNDMLLDSRNAFGWELGIQMPDLKTK